jgi:ribosomal protein L37AE/L43A
MAEVADESPTYACPHCQAEVHVEWPAEPFLRCPQCGEEFALPAEATAAELPIQYVHDELSVELNAQRIQRIVAQRRADIRLRSYFVLAAFGCLAVAITFLCTVGQRLFYRMPWSSADAVQLAIAIFGIVGAGFLLSRAHSLTRELNKPLLPEPTTPPDFSNLGDGSQQAKELEELER